MVCMCVTVCESVRCDGDVVLCDGHEHFEMNVVNELIAIDVDDLFTHLFTDSPVYAEFIRRRRTQGQSLDDSVKSVLVSTGDSARQSLYSSWHCVVLRPLLTQSIQLVYVRPPSIWLVLAECTEWKAVEMPTIDNKFANITYEQFRGQKVKGIVQQTS